MSKFNEKTLERLVKWCDSQDTQFTKFSWEEKNGVVSVFNYDGHGFHHQINSFFSNKEIENFLDESEKRQEELDEYHEEFLKELEEI
ncbi:hypothetical protein QTI99_14575 [Clostridium perfringens]|uniref:hypothetical protein n=1 Tax=Clostridium perfringens TaxID=1502 RepID=UPI002ED19FF8|nr:hypothetical protein [Clostridium perfringens]MDM0998681.1 hypothetical protein [Clostridium perfringens]WVM77538.1 hypothetical protein V1680_15550 [Clostridium perfringens]